MLDQEKEIIKKLIDADFIVNVTIDGNYTTISIKKDYYYLATIYIEDYKKYNFIRCKHYILHGFIESYTKYYTYLIEQLNNFIHAL